MLHLTKCQALGISQDLQHLNVDYNIWAGPYVSDTRVQLGFT